MRNFVTKKLVQQTLYNSNTHRELKSSYGEFWRVRIIESIIAHWLEMNLTLPEHSEKLIGCLTRAWESISAALLRQAFSENKSPISPNNFAIEFWEASSSLSLYYFFVILFFVFICVHFFNSHVCFTNLHYFLHYFLAKKMFLILRSVFISFIYFIIYIFIFLFCTYFLAYFGLFQINY